MTVEVEEKTTRKFRIEEAFIKEKLGIVGNLVAMRLWSGLTPDEDEHGVSHDSVVWEFETVQSLTSKARKQ